MKTLVMVIILMAVPACGVIAPERDVEETVAPEMEKLLAFVIVDSAAIRLEPSDTSTVEQFIPTALQLWAVDRTPDSLWYKVYLAEQQEYQMRHGIQYWIRTQDIYLPTDNARAKLAFDISLFEKPENNFERRIDDRNYKNAGGQFEPPFYVSSANYYNFVGPDDSTSLWDNLHLYGAPTDSMYFFIEETPTDESLQVYADLYADDTLKLFYSIEANESILGVRQKVNINWLLFEDAGCYPEISEMKSIVETLIDSSIAGNGNQIFSVLPFDMNLLVGDKQNLEVQYAFMIFIVEVEYIDGLKELYARRIGFSRPRCL